MHIAAEFGNNNDDDDLFIFFLLEVRWIQDKKLKFFFVLFVVVVG